VVEYPLNVQPEPVAVKEIMLLSGISEVGICHPGKPDKTLVECAVKIPYSLYANIPQVNLSEISN